MTTKKPCQDPSNGFHLVTIPPSKELSSRFSKTCYTNLYPPYGGFGILIPVFLLLTRGKLIENYCNWDPYSDQLSQNFLQFWQLVCNRNLAWSLSSSMLLLIHMPNRAEDSPKPSLSWTKSQQSPQLGGEEWSTWKQYTLKRGQGQPILFKNEIHNISTTQKKKKKKKHHLWLHLSMEIISTFESKFFLLWPNLMLGSNKMQNLS